MSMDSRIIKMGPLKTIKGYNMIQTEEPLMAHIMISIGTSTPRDIDHRDLEMITMKIHFSLTLRISTKMMMSMMSMMKCIKSS